jgi:hypothetical protein
MAIEKKDLRDTFYKNRELEIKNLWQRSIFLASFLVMCFGGYGKIVELLLNSNDNEHIQILHVLAILVCLLGIVFSWLWIAMAKGSKAWQEVYEDAIKSIESEPALNIEEKYRYGQYNLKEGADTNILSCKAGRYSPSKINIAIGQVSLFMWIITILLHCGFFIFNRFGINWNDNIQAGDIIFICVVLVVVIFCICWRIFRLSERLTSGFLTSRRIIIIEKALSKIKNKKYIISEIKLSPTNSSEGYDIIVKENCKHKMKFWIGEFYNDKDEIKKNTFVIGISHKEDFYVQKLREENNLKNFSYKSKDENDYFYFLCDIKSFKEAKNENEQMDVIQTFVDYVINLYINN